MRCMKKGLALFLVVCLLFSTCGNSVLAAENGFNRAVTKESHRFDNSDKAAKELEKTEESDNAGETDISVDSDSITNDSVDSDNKTEKSDNVHPSDEKVDSEETDNSSESEILESDKNTEDNNTDTKSDEDIDDENESINEETSESAASEEESTIDEQLEAAGETGEVSRIEWLAALTDLFEMSVEKDNYPDNYYSDIDSSFKYYYEIRIKCHKSLYWERGTLLIQ